jgi:hypothetical protein
MPKDWILSIFETLIAQESSVLGMFSSEKKADATGRSASLFIDWQGQNGWNIKEYSFLFTAEHGVQWKPDKLEVRNGIYMSENTFYELARGRLEPEDARMHGLIKIAGDSSFYDGLEFQQIWSKIKEKLLGPIVDKALAEEAKRR